MAQMNTRDRDKRRDEWRRRNSGSGLLGNCPVNSFSARVMGRSTNDDRHLTSAARAIVDSIRSMQAKNTYQDNRRDYPRADHKPDRPDYRRRDRDDKPDKDNRPADHQPERFDARNRVNVPVYRQPYLFRQVSEDSGQLIISRSGSTRGTGSTCPCIDSLICLDRETACMTVTQCQPMACKTGCLTSDNL
ncbi:hypothetical protein B5X24_HaOG211235 [Helicoverpa armigera]|uniref:Uncharacterized protein n=1 Tax=Helicoverpa armigera TaxID=29058 RepID=A0A2W1BAK8_HELAM|nr:hypothetical protein B5X24_HaOG211235 [Helicoverpa armigera]